MSIQQNIQRALNEQPAAAISALLLVAGLVLVLFALSPAHPALKALVLAWILLP